MPTTSSSFCSWWGFVLFLEGGHEAGVAVNSSDFPHIPQWIVIFILLLMFSVDLYQNWWEAKVRGRTRVPVELHRRKKRPRPPSGTLPAVGQ